MDKITSTISVVTVSVLLLAGVAASYPSWPQWEAQLQNAGTLPQVTTTTTSTDSSNSTAQAPTPSAAPSNPSDAGSLVAAQSSTTDVPFGPAWVSQFMGIIDSNRGSGQTLADCPALDTFAMTRFQTMTTGKNWEVTHYGYDQDLEKAFGGTAGSYSEDYFFPTEPYLKTPTSFAKLVQNTDPGHWSDLMDTGHRYYGAYYAGQGPILLFEASCAPSEFTGGINQTAQYAGCPHTQVNGTWLVIELSNVCE